MGCSSIGIEFFINQFTRAFWQEMFETFTSKKYVSMISIKYECVPVKVVLISMFVFIDRKEPLVLRFIKSDLVMVLAPVANSTNLLIFLLFPVAMACSISTRYSDTEEFGTDVEIL